MKHIFLIFTIMMLGLMAGLQANAADPSAGNAAPYLRAGAGARALAMGNAATAATNDAFAPLWNPAAMDLLPTWAMSGQTAVLGWDQVWNILGLIYPVHEENHIDYAVGFTWISYSAGNDLERRDGNQSAPDGTFGESQTALVGSLSRSFGDHLHLGINGKILLHHLDDSDANGFALDLGLWHDPMPSLAWGLVIQDLLGSLKWPSEHVDNLPVVIRPGVVWKTAEDKLRVAADLGLLYDNRAGQFNHLAYHAGAEYCLFPFLAIRAGVNDDQATAGLGWTFAVSTMADVALDYAFAWERAASFGYTHLISLSIQLYSANGSSKVNPGSNIDTHPEVNTNPAVNHHSEVNPNAEINAGPDDDDNIDLSEIEEDMP